MTDDIGDFSGDPFSEEERRRIRQILKHDEHVAWFWASVRRWAFWASLAVAGIVTFRENLKAIGAWFMK